MTISDRLITASGVRVGTSAVYPVLSYRTDTTLVGLDDTDDVSYEEVTWELSCLAETTAPTSIAALNETLRADLARRGEAVELSTLGSTRTLPASGPAGSMLGYPRTEISAIPERSFGPYQNFTLRAVTRIPVADANGIWERSQRTETNTDASGNTSTAVSGTVRMVQGNSAADWVNTNIITPARNAADTAGEAMVSRVGVGNDPAQAEYSYTVSPSTTGTNGVSQAQVEDRVAKDESGRWVRTISGFAAGSGASAFANAQLVSEQANLKLLRQDGPSQPQIPDGRVNFSYQYVSGVTHPDFPGLFITRLDETVEHSGGGREVLAAVYLQDAPALRLGSTLPFAVSERLNIEFIGSFAGINPSKLLSQDNAVGAPRISRGGGGVLKTWSRTINYLFDTLPAPMPEPRTLDGII